MLLKVLSGKDKPKELPAEGGTTGLLLRLLKSLFGTRKIVVLDSGFCVLQALIALKQVGVFAAAVIKKRRYWPRYVAGDTIDAHMDSTKEIGETNSVHGTLDNVPYNIFSMREPDYVMKLMSTYGSLVVKGENKKMCVYTMAKNLNFSTKSRLQIIFAIGMLWMTTTT